MSTRITTQLGFGTKKKKKKSMSGTESNFLKEKTNLEPSEEL